MVNLQKTKNLTNVRSSGTDRNLKIAPHVEMSLEQALEYIEDDELVEITPKSIRLRKVHLGALDRKRNKGK
jgi:GTP-binding protein